MKKYRLVFAEINRSTFAYIKSGKKKIETRAATVKYENIKKGDILVLVCGKDSFEKKINKVEHFPSLDALLAKYKPEKINPGVYTKKETLALYHSFPGYKEKIRKYGILAFTLS